jgi:hypothetical protein
MVRAVAVQILAGIRHRTRGTSHLCDEQPWTSLGVDSLRGAEHRLEVDSRLDAEAHRRPQGPDEGAEAGDGVIALHAVRIATKYSVSGNALLDG